MGFDGNSARSRNNEDRFERPSFQSLRHRQGILIVSTAQRCAMMKLLITAFALAGILSAPTFFRSARAAFPNEGIAGCKPIIHPGVNVSMQ